MKQNAYRYCLNVFVFVFVFTFTSLIFSIFGLCRYALVTERRFWLSAASLKDAAQYKSSQLCIIERWRFRFCLTVTPACSDSIAFKKCSKPQPICCTKTSCSDPSRPVRDSREENVSLKTFPRHDLRCRHRYRYSNKQHLQAADRPARIRHPPPQIPRLEYQRFH